MNPMILPHVLVEMIYFSREISTSHARQVYHHSTMTDNCFAAAGANGPPPVSLATVMGPDFATMFANLGAALRGGALAPVEIVATR